MKHTVVVKQIANRDLNYMQMLASLYYLQTLCWLAGIQTKCMMSLCVFC